MATTPNTPPPNDLNKFGQAWTNLQVWLNVTLPLQLGRVTVARNRLHK